MADNLSVSVTADTSELRAQLALAADRPAGAGNGAGRERDRVGRGASTEGFSAMTG